MALEHPHSRTGGDSTTLNHAAAEEGDGYWYSLITEPEAGEFLKFTVRCLQNWRYRGGGPLYFSVGGRSIRYRRIDLRLWTEDRLRTSTSDQPEVAAA